MSDLVMPTPRFTAGKCPSCGHDQHVGRVCGDCPCPPEKERDPESKLRHIAHVAWNALALVVLTRKA